MAPSGRGGGGSAQVAILPSTAAMGEAAAEDAAAVLRSAVANNGVANAMFATGNSQFAFIDAVLARVDVPWSDVVVFHMDEYVGIGPEHPASFQRWIRERIAEPAKPRSTHYIDGVAASEGAG